MQRRPRRAVGAALVIAGALVLPSAVSADPDTSATVQFGSTAVGSPFPVPPGTHDSSLNAMFNLVPRTVVISASGTVTFEIGGPPIHQVAVYAAGTTPDDIVVPPSGTFIDDATNRIALGSVLTSGSTSVPFSSPGRYLVLCNVRPHFAFFNMYGWVEVK